MRLFRLTFACLAALLAPARMPARAEPVELKVMAFNIWRSGVQLSLAQVAAAIKVAKPDMVAPREPEDNSRGTADVLGWSYGEPAIAKFTVTAK